MPELRRNDTAEPSTATRTALSPDAFDRLLAPLAQAAYAVAVCLTRSEHAASRLLPDAAVAAFRRFRELEDERDFRLWFFRILVVTYLASREAETAGAQAADLDDTPDLLLYARSAGAGYPTAGADPAFQLLDTLGPERVMAATALLSEEYRLVCALYFLLELTYEEIARVLDYPVGTVRSRLHRGRKMLQKALWHIAEAEGLTNSPRGNVR